MVATVLTALLALAALAQPSTGAASPHVVFVCEHGAAKSLIASAYFNKLAAERGLAARATFRGVDPQDALSLRAVAGLKEDGLPIPDVRPTAISTADLAAATHFFAIGCAMPADAMATGKASSWNDVPDDQGYGPMRDAVVRHVRALIDTLR